jgi:flagella basal body P-ring formation protein FlgA
MLMDQFRFEKASPAPWRRAVVAVAACCLGAAALAEAPERIAAQVEEAARAQLERRADAEGWLDPRFDLAIVSDAKPLAGCAQPVEVDAADTRSSQRLRFTVRCGAEWKRVVVVRAQVSARVLVAAADIPANKPIAEADLVLERRDLGAVTDAVGDPALAAGQTSRRSLHAGDVLRKGWLMAPVLVRRGDTVRLVVQREQVTVSIVGEALDAGGRGDLVRVRNSSTRQIVSARVTGAGTVAPADMPMPDQSRD